MLELVLLILFGLGAITVITLVFWRWMDRRADQAEMRRLFSTQPSEPDRFDPEMVAELPEPAQRFFNCTITPGTPLYTVAEIDMSGRFGMGDKQNPKYLNMQAKEVLAAPRGFVWQMSARSGLMSLSGSDSQSWTRFWLAGLMPVARFGGTPDHQQSAFGRFVAEAAFWTPAALLPGPNVTWQAIDQNTARYTMRHSGLEQAVDIVVDADGYPVQVVFQRWSNANTEGIFRLQPFGATLSEFRMFEGFCIPTHVEAGNHFGTDAYFPFFIADVSAVRYAR